MGSDASVPDDKDTLSIYVKNPARLRVKIYRKGRDKEKMG